MRWSLARMFYLVTAVAIGLAVYQFWSPDYYIQLHVLHGAWMAVLATASVVALTSPPRWKRFWLSFAMFGWSFFIFASLNGFLLKNIYLWTTHSQKTIPIGLLLGLICGLISLTLPGPVEPPKNGDKQPESEA